MFSLDKHLKCFKCSSLSSKYFSSECCGKLFCSSCVSSLLNSPCPNCKHSYVKFFENAFTKRLLQIATYKCKYGCNKRLSAEQMKTHFLTCDNKTFKCCICKDNNFKGSTKEINIHLIEEHYAEVLVLMEEYSMFLNELNNIHEFKLINKDNQKHIQNINNNDHYELSINSLSQFNNEESDNNLQYVPLENISNHSNDNPFSIDLSPERNNININNNERNNNYINNYDYVPIHDMLNINQNINPIFDQPLNINNRNNYMRFYNNLNLLNYRNSNFLA